LRQAVAALSDYSLERRKWATEAELGWGKVWAGSLFDSVLVYAAEE